MAFDAYSVGIKLSLNNMVSSGLHLLAKDLTGLEKNVANLQDKFSALKTIAVGWGIQHIGSGMLGFIGKSVEVSKEYTHQVAQLGVMGMQQKEIAEVIATSWKTTRDVITSSASDNIEAFRELRGAFGAGHEHEALAILPVAQRASAIVSSLTGKMQSVKDVGYDIAKAAELSTSGGMTMGQMTKRAEQFMQASIAFGGKVTMNDFHSALKMTRGSSLKYSDDFIAHYLPTLIQEMKTGHGGGQQAGTLLRNFDRAVIGQVIPLNKLQNWMDGGLIKSGQVVWNKHHTGLKKIKPGGVVGQDLAMENPMAWWDQYGESALQQLMKKHHLTENQALSALATNQMTADLFKKFHYQKVQFERDKKLIEQVTAAGGTKQKYDQLLKTDPLLAEKAMHKQWENVQARIGFEILPRLIPYMIQFANGLDRISQWMENNPEKTKNIVFGFTGLAIGLDLLGKAMMAAGIIKLLGIGPMLMSALGGNVISRFITAGIGFIGNMIMIGLRAIPVIGWILMIVTAAAWVYRNWDFVKAKAKEVWGFIGPYITGIWDSICDFAKTAWGVLSAGFKGFIGFFLDQWQWAFNNLIDMVNAFLPKVAQLKRFDFADRWNRPEASYSNEGRGHTVPVPPKQSTTVQVHTKLQLDSKVLGESVTIHQTREATKPMTGMRGFDAVSSAVLPTMPSSFYPRG